MKSSKIIHQLIDYVLLNAYSVNSTGFYNGKVGLSLSLFNVSRFLNDNYVEEQAYELLQEALLSSNRDISFENGLGGIGYVLHYLITNKFIEADFRELFEEQTNHIIKTLTNILKYDSLKITVQCLMLVHFLDAIKSYYSNKEIDCLIVQIASASTQLLEERLDNITVKSNKNETRVLSLFEIYIKLADYYESFPFVWSILERYGDFCFSDNSVSNLIIASHLKHIVVKHHHPYLQVVTTTNMKKTIQSLYLDKMSLSQRIELLHLLHESGMAFPQSIKSMEEKLLNIGSHSYNYEQYILDGICSDKFIAGYQYGIARLLLYWVYRNSPIPICHHLFL